MGDVRISAKSTLIALNRSIEVISANLTGANIFGYKGTRLSFADTLVNVLRAGTGATGGQGGLNPIQVSTGGISVGATTTDFSQGSIVQTKNTGDVAIQGNAFFQAADAAGRITYTRNGEFHFDDNGNLVTNDGLFVLGVMDDLRDITQNNKLIDFDETIDFDTDPDPITTAAGNLREGITVDFNLINAVTMFDINNNALPANVMASVLGDTTGPNTLYSFLDLEFVAGLQDRILPFTFIPAGGFGGGGDYVYTIGNIAGPTSSLAVPGPDVPVVLRLNATNNDNSNTSLDNAKLIAQAINDVANQTGVGASIIVNQNQLDQAAIVLTHVQRSISTTVTRLAEQIQPSPGGTTTNLFDSLNTTGSGVLENATDSRGNLYHRINVKSLIGRSPRFVPQSGDRFQFDGTGQLINTSRGQDEQSAPPFSTGIHIAIVKFANDNGLQKVRGSSQFQYTEAAGDIITGYAGQDRGKVIDTRRGIETIGSSIIGTENTIIPNALEASNTSITEALPDLTIAQKSFTSNTKIVNVGNTIVDDLNGLIR